MADSHVARGVESLTTRLETFRKVIVEALDLDDLHMNPVHIYLHDTAIPDQPGDSQNSDVSPATVELRVIYRPDTSSEGLERSILELLLKAPQNYGAEISRPIIDGILGYADLRIEDHNVTFLNRDLSKQININRTFSLADYLEALDTERTALYLQIVTSFVTFLLSTLDPTTFRKFVHKIHLDGLQQATEDVLGTPFSILEEAWLSEIMEYSPVVMGITGLIKRSLTWTRPYWKSQVLIMLTMLIGVGFSSIFPLSNQFLIDRAIIPGDLKLLAAVLIVVVGLFLLNSVGSLIGDYLSARLATRIMNDMRSKMFTHLQYLSMGFHSRSQVGDIMSRLSSDIYVVQTAITTALPSAVQLTLGLVVSSALLFVLKWELALLLFIGVPIFLAGPRLFGRRAAFAVYESQQDEARVASNIQENLGAQSVLKSLGREDIAIQAFKTDLSTLATSTIRASFLSSVIGTFAEVSGALVQVAGLGVGAFMVIEGNLTLGTLVAFLGLLGNVVSPLQNASSLVQMLQESTGGMQRIDELLDEPIDVTDTIDAVCLPRLSNGIGITNLSFSYTGNQLNLKNINLDIRKGENVAIVGPSGCGKSTLINLLLRFYDPSQGSITFDGIDLRDASQQSIRSQIGVVPQESILLNESIRENLRLGRLDATDEEIEDAAKLAGIHETIVNIPQGYDTIVGERGARLSGGQRQRIAIARAMLRDPAILILDEATSALDPESEASIKNALDQLSDGRTIISITHRLSSATNADRIFVLDQGELIEQGTHDQLLALQGVYDQLWKKQNNFNQAIGFRNLDSDGGPLMNVPIFKNLEGVLLSALASRFVTEQYLSGQTIFEETDPGDKFYIVGEGQLEVLATGPTGRQRRIASLSDGDYFGEIALIDDIPRTATVRATAPCILLTLEREQFFNLLGNMPDLRIAFEKISSHRRRVNRTETENQLSC